MNLAITGHRMPIHTVKLMDRYEVAPDTKVFVFERPEHFQFKAGQYAGFTLINPTENDANGHTRRFSLLNAPEENYLAFATRMHATAYKRVLDQLPVGATIKLAGPAGNFVLHHEPAIPAVFIAGGIGITPFYSMIAHAYAQQSPQSLHLFYGNTTLENTAFLTDLRHFAAENPHFHLIPTLEQAPADWQEERGRITPDMLMRHLTDIHQPIYYICGSPAMVKGVQAMLEAMGIAADKIRAEDFPGY